MDLKNINAPTATFWSLGNNPTQKVNNLVAYNVIQHLKLLYLLSDKVLASGSFYFESEITRQITHQLQKLFEEGEILYFIDDDIENFQEHGQEKVRKSPKAFDAYSDKNLVKERAKKLDELSTPLRRPPSSISNKIVELWLSEIHSTEPETLGGIICSTVTEKDRQIEITLSLSKFATERKKDFVWEYLLPHLTKLKLPKTFQNAARRKLSQLYSIATSELLGVSLDNSDLSYTKYISTHTKYDTTLFEECMKILGLNDAIRNLTSIELISLKSSEEFIYFREFYFSLVESSSYKSETVKKILPLFITTEKTFSSGIVNVDDFLKSFSKLCKDLKISSRKYKKPLDIILNRYQTFNKATLPAFMELVNEASLKKEIEWSKISTPKEIFNADQFYLANQDIINSVILNNFKIPKTDAPGKFAEMVSIIIKWFDNFKRSEYSEALLILQNIKFFSEDDVNKLLDKMSSELKKLFSNDFSRVNIFGLGDSGGDSGAQFLYRLRQRLGLTEEYFPKDYNNISPLIQSIVFIDDIIGGGKQATDFCRDNLGNILVDKYYCSLLAFNNGLERIRNESDFKKVFTTYTLTDADKAFSETSEIFSDKEIREKIKIISQYYGQKIYPKGPLGYDDSQALIAFSHNTPNNTLPIIWASVNNEKHPGVPWNPLWERKKVIKKKI